MYKRVTYDFGNVRQVLKYYPGNYGAPGLSRSKKRKRTGEEIRKIAVKADLPDFAEGDRLVILGDEEQGLASFNLYQVVEDKVSLLRNEGISADLIKQIVATDVNVYVKELYNKKHSGHSLHGGNRGGGASGFPVPAGGYGNRGED